MTIRNILFIMCDQLRADFLGCYGNRNIRTPNIDALARQGVRFDAAYCQSATCGPSRMSFYTGRYVISHGATWNEVPLSIANETLSEFFQGTEMRVALVGKTHMIADRAQLERIFVRHGQSARPFLKNWGFEPYCRDDGLHPTQIVDPNYEYNVYLREKGYESDNPWEDFANSATDCNGTVLSGWQLRHSGRPSRLDEEHSETAFTTQKAIEFIKAQGDQPWLLHLSYIKPHWPYMAPVPYHNLYGPEDVPAPIRHQAERETGHAVVEAYRAHRESITFSREEVRRTVIPAYMGLISQIDSHVGRLVGVLRQLGRLDDTLIVFTADHGDYLGDHWLGEKELFYEGAARIPLIVINPEAEACRNVACTAPVEAVDLLPTFLDAVGRPIPDMVLEGQSLMPWVRQGGQPEDTGLAICELDYTFRPARESLGLDLTSARAFMVREGRWKYVHYHGARCQLFDLSADPKELHDLGLDAGYQAVRDRMRDGLLDWFMRRKVRVTRSRQEAEAMMGVADKFGMLIGVW